MARNGQRRHDSASNSNSSLSSSDNDSGHSRCSYFTETTIYSPRPSIAEGEKDLCKPPNNHHHATFRDSGASLASYTSSILSEDEFSDHVEEYTVAPPVQEVYQSDAIQSTPLDFAELFPSSRTLLIAHDDATTDGNMNLRIDTIVANAKGEQKKMILYHLKMNDLKTRKCSLRRHCRDSGREVCQSSVKERIHEDTKKYSIARSISSAMSLLFKADIQAEQPAGIHRHDSGYGSTRGFDETPPDSPLSATRGLAIENSNVMSLEFSNYARLDIKRQGFGDEKRYDFQYWGIKYSWQKMQSRNAGQETVSYNLIRQKDNKCVAHIKPVPMTKAQRQEEIEQGGWIPPCSMQILDQHIIDAADDVSDVVVATGLLTLVDGSIRRHFHPKTIKQFVLPSPISSLSPRRLEFMSPRRLIDEAFGRGRRVNATQ